MSEPTAIVEDLDELTLRARERGLQVVGVDDETLQKLAEEARQEEIRQARLEDCRRRIEEITPPQFRSDIELQPQVARWLDDFWSLDRDEFAKAKNGLCLVGRPGAGKTHTAWQVVRKLLERGWDDIAVHSVPVLFDEFTHRSQNKRADKDLIDSLVSVDLLVLDDLGAKPLTEFREERLLRVLDGRYVKQLPTIVTTNIGTASFSEHFGGRNASRIAGMCRVVLFPNKDWRSGIDFSEIKKGAGT